MSGLFIAGAACAQGPVPASEAVPVEASSTSEAPQRVKPAAHTVLAVALEPVTLAPNAKLDPELEADCKFEEILGVDVSKMLHHYHLGGGKPMGNDARLLRVTVTDVSGATGGVYSGTKSMRIHAALLVDGKIERETDLYRYNTGGNPFRGTCHIFRQHTKKLGKDLASWIKDARYKTDDKAMGEKDDVE